MCLFVYLNVLIAVLTAVYVTNPEPMGTPWPSRSDPLTSCHMPLTAVWSNPTGCVELFHVKKISCWLPEGRWFYPVSACAVNTVRWGHLWSDSTKYRWIVTIWPNLLMRHKTTKSKQTHRSKNTNNICSLTMVSMWSYLPYLQYECYILYRYKEFVPRSAYFHSNPVTPMVRW